MYDSVGRVESRILVHRALPVRVADPAHRSETHVHLVPIFHKVCPMLSTQKCTRYNHIKEKKFNISFFNNWAKKYMERNREVIDVCDVS